MRLAPQVQAVLWPELKICIQGGRTSAVFGTVKYLGHGGLPKR